MTRPVFIEPSVIPSDLQREVLAGLLRDAKFAARFILNLSEDNFENPIYRTIFSIAKTFYIRQLRIIPKQVLERELSTFLTNNDKIIPYPHNFFWRELNRLYAVSLDQIRDYLTEKLTNLLLKGQLSKLSERSLEEARKEEPRLDLIDREISRLYEICSGVSVRERGEFLLQQASARIRRAPYEDKVPTGLRVCDTILGGGLGKGEMGVVLAPTGYGKSFWLVTIGANAVRRQKKVIHVTLEMSKEKVIERYETHLTRITKERLVESENDVIRKLSRLRRLLSPGDVYVIHFPMRSITVEELRVVINQISFVEEFFPDLIIIDYGDVIKPRESRNAQRYELLGEIYEKLVALAHELNVPLWTGSQARRISVNKEFVTVADMAESFAKAQVADVIIAICRTREEEMTHRGRFYFAKVRDNPGKQVVPFVDRFEIARFEEIPGCEVTYAEPEIVEFTNNPEDD